MLPGSGKDPNPVQEHPKDQQPCHLLTQHSEMGQGCCASPNVTKPAGWSCLPQPTHRMCWDLNTTLPPFLPCATESLPGPALLRPALPFLLPRHHHATSAQETTGSSFPSLRLYLPSCVALHRSDQKISPNLRRGNEYLGLLPSDG